MTIDRRTVLTSLAAVLVWAFFFVPNGLVSVLNIQGNERLPIFAFFGFIPAGVGLVLSLLLKRERATAAVVTIGVPVLGITTILALWMLGYYSSEDLIGAWLSCLLPIPAYAVGVLLGLWLGRAQYIASS